jgi:hypothetical protein
LNDVQNSVVAIIDALYDARTIQNASIAGLAAAGWIEGSAIKNDSRPTTDTLSHVNHASFKLNEMGVVVVKTFGGLHRFEIVIGN